MSSDEVKNGGAILPYTYPMVLSYVTEYRDNFNHLEHWFEDSCKEVSNGS
jgi:hypothetical protein